MNDTMHSCTFVGEVWAMFYFVSQCADLLMGAYIPSATPTELDDSNMASECDEATDEDLQPSASCQLLLERRDDSQQGSTSQQGPAGRPSPPLAVPAQGPLQNQAQAVPLPGPPSKPASRKRSHRGTASERQLSEDAALGTLIAESVKQMAQTCRRPHLDTLDPTTAYAIHLANEVKALPPRLQSHCKLAIQKVLHEHQMLHLHEEGEQQ